MYFKINKSYYFLLLAFGISQAQEVKNNQSKDSIKGQNLDEVVIIGSRSSTNRTNVERPVPVDVLTSKELRQTGQTEIGQQVQFMSPSYNSSKNGINGVANYADPASLKGLSPDQMLVLIDGKRRHQFSAVNSNVTVGKGTVVTDMNSIPSLALERVEILRDGAAAQYGSDAIAGIVNLVLKKSVSKGIVQIQSGSTTEGDGAGYTVGTNYGFKVGKRGSINLSASWQSVDGTNRSDPYDPQPVATVAYKGIYSNTPATDKALLASRGYWGNGTYGSFKVGEYGSNKMKSGQLFYNLDLPLENGWTIYSNGGYSNKKVYAKAFLRTAVSATATYSPLYADGYVPDLPGTSVDYSIVGGIKRKISGGWNMDFSTGYGKNYLDQYANNSANPSLGLNSPKDFYAGRVGFGQSLTEANISKTILGFAGTKSTSFSFGSQYRVDNFTLTAGDDLASPSGAGVGPLAAAPFNKTPGSQGRVGIDKTDETNKSRSNIGVYADLESDLTDKFLISTAVRFENYSDFGSNFSGKLASRYKLTENFSVRGSINKGFRAPLLQQIASSATTSTVQAGILSNTKQLPSSDPRLAMVGVADPKAETSWNYNIGFTAKAGKNLLFTVDAYQIDITDRIIVTENLAVASIAALAPLFPGVKEITFFTNAIATKTKGIDFVTAYKTTFDNSHKLTASLAFTVNKTIITNVDAVPDKLQAGTVAPVILIDAISKSLIETSQPHTKVLASIGYAKYLFWTNNSLGKKRNSIF
jgi:iron complex outermembrane recepter protein